MAMAMDVEVRTLPGSKNYKDSAAYSYIGNVLRLMPPELRVKAGFPALKDTAYFERSLILKDARPGTSTGFEDKTGRLRKSIKVRESKRTSAAIVSW